MKSKKKIKKISFNEYEKYINLIKIIKFNNLNNLLIKNCFIYIILIFNVIFTFNLIKNNNNTIIKESNYYNKLIKKINNFIIICRQGKLIKNIPYTIFHYKITAVVILFNSEKTIKTAIRSIQNQNMTDIEILLIDDYSMDDSIRIIERLAKEDSRIKIIKNNKNRGSLYSRSIGALKANGKYIMALDSDDLFINENIFNICYNEAETYNLDIVEFAGFHIKRRILKTNNKLPKKAFYLRFKKYNKIYKQPYLFNLLYKKNNTQIIRLIDGYIWGKCIKKSIYKYTLDKLGEKIYTQYLNFGEDRIVNFALFQVANSFKYINEYGIIYYYNKLSIYNSYNKELILHDELINFMSIYNFTKNTSNLKILSYEIIFRWNSIILPGLNNEYKKQLKYLIKSLLNSEYIGYNDKINLSNYLNILEELK